VEEIAGAPATSGVAVRKALLADVPAILGLINGFAAQGMMLARTEFELAENVRDFTVALHDGAVAGCGALHFYGAGTGEIRSLAVHPGRQRLGLGRHIIEALESEARAHGLHSVFAFTYVPDYFARFGYLEVDRQLLPAKVWKDCLRCPKLQCCDEIAVRKLLTGEGVEPPVSGAELVSNGTIILPVVPLVRPPG